MTWSGPGSNPATGSWSTSGLPDFWIRISQPRQIGGPRMGVQFLQQGVIASLLLAGRNFAVKIVQIAEDNRLGRTCLLAGGDDFSVAERAVLLFRINLGGIDALDAI